MRSRALLGAGGLLLAGVVLVTGWQVRRLGGGVARWRFDVVWSRPAAERAWHVFVAHGGDGLPNVVVHGLHSLVVWTGDGRQVANGTVTFGTVAAVGDFTGDGVDEIAVAAESLPPDAPVSIQVVDMALDPVSPNVGVLEGLENPASVVIAPMKDSRQVVAGDFRGCLVSLVPPEMVWEHCFPDSAVGGDPYAVRHLAAVVAGGRPLVLAGRATGEVAALDESGAVAWSYRLHDPLSTFAVAPAPGGEVMAFAGGNEGAYAVLDAGTGAVRGSGGLPGMVMAARPMTWKGRPALAVGGQARGATSRQSGFVAVVGDDGERLSVIPLDGQVMDVAAGDLDGDGRDELVAVTGAYRMLVLSDRGTVMFEERVEPSDTKVAALPTGGGAAELIVADASHVESRRMAREAAPAWYGPLPAGAAVAAILALALASLLTLRYPASPV